MIQSCSSYNIIITIDGTKISFFIITLSKCVDENKVVSYIINKATDGSNTQKPDKVVSFFADLNGKPDDYLV